MRWRVIDEENQRYGVGDAYLMSGKFKLLSPTQIEIVLSARIAFIESIENWIYDGVDKSWIDFKWHPSPRHHS